MQHIQILFRLIKKFFCESNNYKIYSLIKNDQYLNYHEPEVKIFLRYSDVPDFLKKKLIINPIINPLFYRLRLSHAILLSVYKGTEIISYGWVQTWHPFKRKFGWMFKEATMLGPYWTNNLYRGKGYYGQLLKQSIQIADKSYPLFIYTTPENISSQKGIEKLGFQNMGIYKINLFLRYFVTHKKIE